MVLATIAKGVSGKNLVQHAVQQHQIFSREGLLEQLFAFAFRGLVYPQIWEDPVVDMAAMQLQPQQHIVAIASGGCNVLSYLTAAPVRITAVDLNPAHVALTKLKLGGLHSLPDWASYYRFFGEANRIANLQLYDSYLKPQLDPETRAYWESRTWTGRKRIADFGKNFYHKGLLGRFIGAGHLAARLYGCDLRLLLKARGNAEQQNYFDQHVAPLLRKPLVRWISERKVSLYGLGIPPAQYAALSGGRPMNEVLLERLRRLACDFPVQENYFAAQAFGRAYATGSSAALPPYLQSGHFVALRQRASQVTVMQQSMTDALLAMPARSVDRVVLLDAQDWMDDQQLNQLWLAIGHVAAPDARVIFRTAGEPSILPGRLAAHQLQRWHYEADLSRQLQARDRSSIYGGFHVYALSR